MLGFSFQYIPDEAPQQIYITNQHAFPFHNAWQPDSDSIHILTNTLAKERV